MTCRKSRGGLSDDVPGLPDRNITNSGDTLAGPLPGSHSNGGWRAPHECLEWLLQASGASSVALGATPA